MFGLLLFNVRLFISLELNEIGKRVSTHGGDCGWLRSSAAFAQEMTRRNAKGSTRLFTTTPASVSQLPFFLFPRHFLHGKLLCSFFYSFEFRHFSGKLKICFALEQRHTLRLKTERNSAHSFLFYCHEWCNAFLSTSQSHRCVECLLFLCTS